MDLISRKAAIDALGEEPLCWNNTIAEVQEWIDWKYHVNAIKSIPTIPAVPLDKLCEWLASIPMMNCRVCKETVGFCDGKTNNICGSAEQWKAILIKWMEGLDAADYK